jgi:hypothetical protein
MTFRAIYSEGRLEPVDVRLELHEKEAVWVTLQRDPRAILARIRWDGTGLEEIRARLRRLPPLHLDETLAEDRENRV